MNQTLQTEGRTWFGTLTLSMESQRDMLDRARLAAVDPHAPWWDEVQCDYRFAAVRAQIVKEVQRFWKRLRKAGHRFKYVLVFERHKSGLPHMHFLLHEQGKPITKRALQEQWTLGFSNVSIVGGRSARAVAPERAAWYVVKYLTKSDQSRVISSRGYRPLKRSQTRSAESTCKPRRGYESYTQISTSPQSSSENSQHGDQEMGDCFLSEVDCG